MAADTGMGALESSSRISFGRLFSKAASLAASTGSIPANGGVCSNNEYIIIAYEYTSTCNNAWRHTFEVQQLERHQRYSASRGARSGMCVDDLSMYFDRYVSVHGMAALALLL